MKYAFIKAEGRLAHLIQGVEAPALKSIIDMHSDQMCLVQHDGWVSPDLLHAKAIEAAVLEVTGRAPTVATFQHRPNRFSYGECNYG